MPEPEKWQDPDTLGGRVAANLRYAMGLRRVSGIELGRAIGIRGSGISDRNTGKARWQLDEIEKACEYLEVSLRFVLGLPQAEQPPVEDSAPHRRPAGLDDAVAELAELRAELLRTAAAHSDVASRMAAHTSSIEQLRIRLADLD